VKRARVALRGAEGREARLMQDDLKRGVIGSKTENGKSEKVETLPGEDGRSGDSTSRTLKGELRQRNKSATSSSEGGDVEKTRPLEGTLTMRDKGPQLVF